MTESAEESAPTTARTFRGWIAEMPRWKKISLLAAGALVATGAVMMMLDPGSSAPADAGAGLGSPGGPGTRNSALETSLLPGQPGTGPTSSTTQEAAADEPAAKGVFRLGFSFIAGFCLGSFVRATLKIVSIAFGFWLAMTIALSYYGLVEVNWEGIDSLWNHFAANVQSEWSSFQSFITGSLPAAGLVATGFAIGIKRH
ncbi:MAG: FUN14 domain-containing protein [Planctomycetes bacterium]|nr:FUN14 domain-containing protein [Planctomycetota bacterium]